MKKNLLLILMALVVNATFAQSSSRFTITRGVVASGGAIFSISSRFQLGSTIAQPTAAVPSSARFSMQGGFWIRPVPVIFAPTIFGNNLMVSVQTESGEVYTVQYIDAVSNSNWQTLTNFTGDGTVKMVTNSAPQVRQRFYRLLQH